ncbi:unnamed protein product [Linum trigynum]|uniref:Uncharacterized protein n=1 Tax=Linum trigynum TaxID=586398 RepID=A0AAV2GCJ9_9ROSI
MLTHAVSFPIDAGVKGRTGGDRLKQTTTAMMRATRASKKVMRLRGMMVTASRICFAPASSIAASSRPCFQSTPIPKSQTKPPLAMASTPI